jgi:hypothetical protein
MDKLSLKYNMIGFNASIGEFLELIKKNEADLNAEEKEALADLIAEVMEELSYFKKAYLGK